MSTIQPARVRPEQKVDLPSWWEYGEGRSQLHADPNALPTLKAYEDQRHTGVAEAVGAVVGFVAGSLAGAGGHTVANSFGAGTPIRMAATAAAAVLGGGSVGLGTYRLFDRLDDHTAKTRFDQDFPKSSFHHQTVD
jgi:hypothetical protein